MKKILTSLSLFVVVSLAAQQANVYTSLWKTNVSTQVFGLSPPYWYMANSSYIPDLASTPSNRWYYADGTNVFYVEAEDADMLISIVPNTLGTMSAKGSITWTNNNSRVGYRISVVQSNNIPLPTNNQPSFIITFGLKTNVF